MGDLLDFSNPNTMGYIGLMQGLGQAAMPSRLPVPNAAVFGMAAGGLAQGQQQGLQNAMLWQKLKMMQNDPILNGSMFGQSGQQPTQQPSQPAQPAIAPSAGGALGSGTFGMGIGGQQAVSGAPASSGAAPASGAGGGLFGSRLSPIDMFRLGYQHSILGLQDGPELMKLAAQYDPKVPTEVAREATQAGLDPRAVLSAKLRKDTFIPPTSMRPGGGIADFNRVDANGNPTMITMPAQPSPGTINIPTPGTPSGFTNIPVTGALPNIAASAGAEAGGKAAGKAPFESLTINMSDGTTVNMSPLQWAQYQQTGQLPGQAGSAPIPAAPATGATPPRGTASSDTVQILNGELQKAQDQLQNWRQYMSPNELMRDPQGIQFRARVQGDITSIQNELRRNGGAAPAASAVPAVAAPVLGRSAPPGLQESQRASQTAPSEQMKTDYGNMAAAGPQAQQSLEYLDHMLRLANKKPFYMGMGVGGMPYVDRISTDAAEYEKARASYISAQGKALGSSGTDAARATIEQAVPEYGKPQEAMARGLTDQRNQLVLTMLRRQLLAPVYQTGDEKSYTALANGFDQNIKPSMAPILSLPAEARRAAVKAAIQRDPSQRASFEWAFNHGLLQ